jgi:hypothetical protein
MLIKFRSWFKLLLVDGRCCRGGQIDAEVDAFDEVG